MKRRINRWMLKSIDLKVRVKRIDDNDRMNGLMYERMHDADGCKERATDVND